jgi:hypothetical protein
MMLGKLKRKKSDRSQNFCYTPEGREEGWRYSKVAPAERVASEGRC